MRIEMREMRIEMREMRIEMREMRIEMREMRIEIGITISIQKTKAFTFSKSVETFTQLSTLDVSDILLCRFPINLPQFSF